ncbi:FecR family protein [Croceicoccus marinus]|uniref:FecR domain-containing protein n=1 Tax=Croceicoccus marinus TaxID=450378 RepID=A0A7G6VV99_9SPHN|nr:FecR domain-containing protein [Croceicoccus marinus]QNE05664.1 FecR domain-containing protein [Croceicoccus marinus]
MVTDETIREQALEWAVRTGDPDFADWDAFTLWLERSPAHTQAYDRIAAAADEAADLLQSAAPANDDIANDGYADDDPATGETPRPRRWIGGMLALILVALVSLGLWRQMAPDLYTIETAPGEMQVVALGSGSQMRLAGGSRVVLDRDDPRFASLEHGRALFSVRHDESDPFVVTAGQNRIVDVGTVFEVRLDPEAFGVAVSEGAVQFDPDGQDVHVAAGQALRRTPDGYQLADIDPAQVGEWAEGRLTFDAETLAAAAQDLTRATGLRFAVDPASADRVVSGSILVAPVRDDPRSLGPLLGLRVRSQSGGWIIGAR